MNKRKKIVLGSVLGLATLLAGGVFANKVSAYRGDYTEKRPNCNTERHEQMESAFENNDYNAWKNLMNGRGRVLQVVNEQNFNRFAEAHKLAMQGDYDDADKIREELGLRTRESGPLGQGFGEGKGKNQNRGQGQRGLNK